LFPTRNHGKENVAPKKATSIRDQFNMEIKRLSRPVSRKKVKAGRDSTGKMSRA